MLVSHNDIPGLVFQHCLMRGNNSIWVKLAGVLNMFPETSAHRIFLREIMSSISGPHFGWPSLFRCYNTKFPIGIPSFVSHVVVSHVCLLWPPIHGRLTVQHLQLSCPTCPTSQNPNLRDTWRVTHIVKYDSYLESL